MFLRPLQDIRTSFCALIRRRTIQRVQTSAQAGCNAGQRLATLCFIYSVLRLKLGGGGVRSPLGGRRGKGTQQSVIQGGSAPRSNPFRFIQLFDEKTYPFHLFLLDKWQSHTKLRTYMYLHPFHSQTGKTVNPRNIFLECYCVAGKKPIKHGKN